MESMHNVGYGAVPPEEMQYRTIETQAVERLKYVVDAPSIQGCHKTTYSVYSNHIAVESDEEDPATRECTPGKLREFRIAPKQYKKVLRQFRREIKECDPSFDCEQCYGAGVYRASLYTSPFDEKPFVSAWTDSCPCQHGQGGICGDGAEFDGFLSRLEKAAKKKMKRMKFTRNKVNNVASMHLTLRGGSFPCAETTSYTIDSVPFETIDSFSIVKTTTNLWFEGANCEEIYEETTIPLSKRQFQGLRRKLITYKIKQCSPNYMSELRGEMEPAGGGRSELVLLNNNGKTMLDEYTMMGEYGALCGDVESLSTRVSTDSSSRSRALPTYRS